ncbi:winged helix-turn-helix transcriptional regulator [Actinomadura roseirufa]|uniref:winged helix-turn-helix transcriptional regulator n=1 Tax=Actinomadura roseirufa TaxID=2094049 RepID=UPI001041A618|nr:helix-turn-helix domain-containing protein [Actinomadura roseirufa]
MSTTLTVPVTLAEYQSCPATVLLRRAGGKWPGLILALLRDRPYGFNELDRAVEGLSRRVLTRTLRTLERDGLVGRTVGEGRSPRVEYALTELGRSLQAQLTALALWAVEHDGEIREAQERFDATP